MIVVLSGSRTNCTSAAVVRCLCMHEENRETTSFTGIGRYRDDPAYGVEISGAEEPLTGFPVLPHQSRKLEIRCASKPVWESFTDFEELCELRAAVSVVL